MLAKMLEMKQLNKGMAPFDNLLKINKTVSFSLTLACVPTPCDFSSFIEILLTHNICKIRMYNEMM